MFQRKYVVPQKFQEYSTELNFETSKHDELGGIKNSDYYEP